MSAQKRVKIFEHYVQVIIFFYKCAVGIMRIRETALISVVILTGVVINYFFCVFSVLFYLLRRLVL